MSQTTTDQAKVVPAQLSFLAIYNRSFGITDESAYDQIVFYHSRIYHARKQAAKSSLSEPKLQEGNQDKEDEKNERLRQIGLVQGMVDFAKNFSNGASVDSVETEKSRIILHEIEPDWWILASIDLTKLPTPKKSINELTDSLIEYSAREVSPPELLLTQLQQAHSLFLLHHAASLWELYNRLGRDNFCKVLERFWKKFVWEWDVLLHGNPAVTIYNGVKLAGGGELGMGVGEEEWGSGEREVLEGFVSRTEGLIDLVVGRYGDERLINKNKDRPDVKDVEGLDLWLGSDQDPGAPDGVIFSGLGVLSRRSLATVSQWMNAIFKHGESAYGVRENPSSRPRQRRKTTKPDKSISDGHDSPSKGPEGKHAKFKSTGNRTNDLRRKAMKNHAAPPRIPAPLVGAVEQSLIEATAKAQENESTSKLEMENGATKSENVQESSLLDASKMMSYLKLGYGSSWTLDPKGLNPQVEADAEDSTPGDNSHVEVSGELQEVDPTPEASDVEETPYIQQLEQSNGKFLIGLSGDLENAEFESDSVDDTEGASQKLPRIFMRTLNVHFAKSRPPSANSKSSNEANAEIEHHVGSVDEQQDTVIQKVQVAVYLHQPFIFIFLFGLHNPNLTIPSFYHGIHHQLGPLQKPLLRSTEPARIADRVAALLGETNVMTSATKNATIYDVVYDPVKLTVRTLLPNIPIPGSLAAEGLTAKSASVVVSGSWYTLGIPISSSASESRPKNLTKSEWTRVEALSVHMQILNIWSATRSGSEFERTIKTGRGWWILWMKVAGKKEDDTFKEAVLVRKATDYTLNTQRDTRVSTTGKWLLRDQSKETSSGSGAATTKGVAEGLGLDARKWVDSLSQLS